MAQRKSYAAPVVPGLWKWLWKKMVHEFGFDPRLSVPSMENAAAEELEAARKRWIATECHRLAELKIGSPRERFAAGQPIVFQRWVLGRGKTWTDDYIVEHPLVADRSVRWLSVDADDRSSVSQEGREVLHERQRRAGQCRRRRVPNRYTVARGWGDRRRSDGAVAGGHGLDADQRGRGCGPGAGD